MRVGGYELGRRVGAGGMGTVYEASAPDGQRVAIKLLHRSSPTAVARFERERRLLAAFGEADGFVPLLASGDAREGRWLAMPFLPGGTLREAIARGPLPLGDAVALGRSLARALAVAHARGVVHRDLKPENVLFSADGRPLVADLGLAKLLDEAPDDVRLASLTRSGSLHGTVGYCPLEQMRDARSAGPPADVFALGAILYEALAGRPAFAGATVLELIAAVEAGRFEPLAKARPEVPDWLARAVESMLARDPARRPGDGAAAARSLAGEGRRSRRALLVLAAAGIGLAVAMLAARSWGPRPPVVPGAPPVAVPAPPPTAAAPPVAAPAAAPPAAAPEAPPPPRARDLPAQTAGFRTGARLTLLQALGSYGWKHAMSYARPVALSGGRVLSASQDRTLKLWKLGTDRELLSLNGHVDSVTDVAVTRDERHAVSCSLDGTVRVWDLAHGAAPRVLDLRVGRLVRLLLRPDERVVFARTGSPDGEGQVVAWDLATGRQAFELPDHDGVNAMALSPDGNGLATATAREVRVFDLARRAFAWRVPVPARHEALVFSADGERLVGTVSGPGRQAVEVHRARTGELVKTHPERRLLIGPGFPGEGCRFAVQTDRGIAVLDVDTGAEVSGPVGRLGPFVLPIEPRRALVCGWLGISSWTVPEETLVPLAAGHRGPVVSVASSADGRLAASASADGSIRLWDLEAGAELIALPGEGPSPAVTFSRDGRRVVAVRESDLEGFDVAPPGANPTSQKKGRSLLRTFAERGLVPPGRTFRIRAERGSSTEFPVAYFPDAKSILRVAGVRLIRSAVEGGRELGSWHVGGGARAVAMDPSGRYAVTGGTDRLACAWNLDGELRSRPLGEHGGTVQSVAVSPDGRLVATGSADWTLRLFDLDTGASLDRLDLSTSADFPTALAFSADGTTLLAGTGRGIVLRFAVAPR